MTIEKRGKISFRRSDGHGFDSINRKTHDISDAGDGHTGMKKGRSGTLWTGKYILSCPAASLASKPCRKPTEKRLSAPRHTVIKANRSKRWRTISFPGCEVCEGRDVPQLRLQHPGIGTKETYNGMMEGVTEAEFNKELAKAQKKETRKKRQRTGACGKEIMSASIVSQKNRISDLSKIQNVKKSWMKSVKS